MAQARENRRDVMGTMTRYLFLIFAQESRSVTVRLNTREPGRESAMSLMK
jgi:hypothetical protein